MMKRQDGFTLVEIMVSLAIFVLIVVGAMSVLGGSNLGGFLETFPTAFGTGRAAKDVTAASVYLQAFQEYVASVPADAAIGAGAGSTTYTCAPPSMTCTPALPGALASAPTPTGQPYQLNWTSMVILLELWYWDATNLKYCLPGSAGCTATASGDSLIHAKSTLTWQLKNTTRNLSLERFISN